MASQLVIDKARRLLREERVQQATPDEIWLVDSESGVTYAVLVWLGEPCGLGKRTPNVRCLCPAGRAQKPCAHALAVMAER